MKWSAAALLVALAGCGGGGAVQSAPTTGTIAPAGTADVQVVVAVPRGSTSRSRAPLYVSQGTASISVTVAGITASAACASPATTCSVDVAAPLGSDTFAIVLYDANNAVLSSGSTTATIAANVLNTVSVTFDGVVSMLNVSLSSPSITLGASAVDTLSVVAEDADGYVIVQPGNYTQPIVVTTTPTLPAAFSFGGPTTIAAIPSSTTMIPVDYTGALASGPIVFTATAGTVTGSATLTIPVPGGVAVTPSLVQFTTVPGSSSVAVSETNYAGTFAFAAVPAGSCTGIVTLGTFSAGTLPLTSTGVGSCTVKATDSIGGSATFTVNVGTTTLVGS